MKTLVRSTLGAPILSDFVSGEGTPVVVDRANGHAYVLKIGDLIVDLKSGFVSAFDFMTVAQVTDVAGRTGAVDVTTALQSAIDALVGGGLLYFPPGVYRTSATLYIPSNVNIMGAGPGATTVNCVTSSVVGSKGIIKSAAFAFDGSCGQDDYVTYSSSTGDYFTTTPKAFAASSTIKAGATSFTAASAGDLTGIASGTWLYLSEGVPAWHPAKSEFIKCGGVSGTTVTLNDGTRNTYSNAAFSLGAFIRAYALTASPGGGGAGYPNMSGWIDAGFRKVTPVENASLRDLTITSSQSGGVSAIPFILHLAVNCKVQNVQFTGRFWCLDSQDITLDGYGGTFGGTCFIGNGCNGLKLSLDLDCAAAIEEGAQNVTGTIKTKGYSTVKKFASDINLDWSGIADATPTVEISECSGVVIKPNLKSRSTPISCVTSKLNTIATDLDQGYMISEIQRYYLSGGTLIGGRCVSTDNATVSINTSNGVPFRVYGTEVPVDQTGRFKGHVVVNGARKIPVIATLPLYENLEDGEEFLTDSNGAVRIAGSRETTVITQFGWSGTTNQIIVNSVTNIAVGDIAVWRVSNSAAAPVAFAWQAAAITAINVPSKILTYTPSSAQQAITAAGQNRIVIFRPA